MKVMIERILLGYYLVLLAGLILLAEAPETLRIRYLEARVANAEAVTRFEQSLTEAQRNLRDEANKQARALQVADKAIQQDCLDRGKLPVPGSGLCTEKPETKTDTK